MTRRRPAGGHGAGGFEKTKRDKGENMQIESFFPGRIRVSSQLFTREERLSEAKRRIGAIEGIGEVTGNIRTGSLTVLYNPLVVSTAMLLEAKEEIERLETERS